MTKKRRPTSNLAYKSQCRKFFDLLFKIETETNKISAYSKLISKVSFFSSFEPQAGNSLKLSSGQLRLFLLFIKPTRSRDYAT